MRAALALVIVLAGACGDRADILVVFDGTQKRWAPPMDCRRCRLLDRAAGAPGSEHFDLLVLDGHSLPGEATVGFHEIELVALLRAVQPRSVVLNTCFGANLQLLRVLFDAVPALEEVAGAPRQLAWGSSWLDERCLEERPADLACVRPVGLLETYRRADLAALDRAAARLRDDVLACHRSIPFVRVTPTCVCVTASDVPPAIWRLNPHELEPSCSLEPGYDLVHCQRGGDGAPVCATPAG